MSKAEQQPALRHKLDQIIRKCTELDENDRFSDAGQVLLSLDGADGVDQQIMTDEASRDGPASLSLDVAEQSAVKIRKYTATVPPKLG